MVQVVSKGTVQVKTLAARSAFFFVFARLPTAVWHYFYAIAESEIRPPLPAEMCPGSVLRAFVVPALHALYRIGSTVTLPALVGLR